MQLQCQHAATVGRPAGTQRLNNSASSEVSRGQRTTASNSAAAEAAKMAGSTARQRSRCGPDSNGRMAFASKPLPQLDMSPSTSVRCGLKMSHWRACEAASASQPAVRSSSSSRATRCVSTATIRTRRGLADERDTEVTWIWKNIPSIVPVAASRCNPGRLKVDRRGCGNALDGPRCNALRHPRLEHCLQRVCILRNPRLGTIWTRC